MLCWQEMCSTTAQSLQDQNFFEEDSPDNAQVGNRSEKNWDLDYESLVESSTLDGVLVDPSTVEGHLCGITGSGDCKRAGCSRQDLCHTDCMLDHCFEFVEAALMFHDQNCMVVVLAVKNPVVFENDLNDGSFLTHRC